MKLEEAKSESHKKIAEQLAVYKAADILQANVPADIAKHLVKDGAQVANIARLLKDGSVTADDLKELKKLSADQIAGWAAQLDDSKRTVATQPSMLDMLLSSGQFRGLKVDSDGNALIKLDGNDTPTKVVIPKVTAPQPAAQAAR